MRSVSLLLLVLVFTGLLSAAPERVVTYYDGTSASYFEDDNYWADPYEAREWFSDRALTYDETAHAMDYRAVPRKEKAAVSILYWRPSGILPAQKIVVRARNLGEVPCYFGMTWQISREGDPGVIAWDYWGFPEEAVLPPDGAWHDLAFPVDPERIWGSGVKYSKVPFFQPFGAIGIEPRRLPKDKLTHFQIAEIRGEDEVACRGSLAWTKDFPRAMTAGQMLDLPGFEVAFEGRMPLDHSVRLLFRRLDQDDEYPVLPIDLTEFVQREQSRWILSQQELPLTPFLADGEYEVAVACGDAILKNALFAVQIHGKAQMGFADYRVLSYGGRATMHCNGKPMTGAMRATYASDGPKGVKTFSDAGIGIFGFSATPTDGQFNLSTLAEYAPGRYDWNQFDRRMRVILDAEPDAKVVVRLDLYAPRWWSQSHPDDIVQIGFPEDPDGKVFPLLWDEGRACPSYASRAWRDETNRALRSMLHFLQTTSYADRIAGFVLGSGSSEEWVDWTLNPGTLADYSPAAEKGFREWLARKYTDDAALQKAWGDADVTLAMATQPRPNERHAQKYPGIRRAGAPGAQRLADFYRYHSEIASECINEFSRTIKEATDGKVLVGAFYGYYVELAGHYRLNGSGHLGVGKNILQSPWIDFLCSPTGYTMRQTGGDGLSYAMGAADSLQLHNKFWFVENDIRTSATPNVQYGRPDDVAGDVLQHTKESMHTLLTGMAQWWFDVGHIRFVDRELMECIRQCVEAMDEVTQAHSRESVAQVALLLDEASADWTTPDAAFVGHAVRNFQMTLARMGAPYEVYLTDDLPNLPERLRVLILPTSLTWTAEQKAALERFERDGRVVLFLGTPGVIPSMPGQTPDESAQELTGLPLHFETSPNAHAVVADAPDGDWLPEQLATTKFTGAFWMDGPGSNLMAVLSPAADVRLLGHYADAKSGAVEPAQGALGVRETGKASIVFSALVTFPKELLASIYAKAGVHRYVDSPDQVWACRDALALCVQEGGTKILRLPRPCTAIRDLLTGERYSVDAEGTVCLEFQPRQTRAFVLEE